MMGGGNFPPIRKDFPGRLADTDERLTAVERRLARGLPERLSANGQVVTDLNQAVQNGFWYGQSNALNNPYPGLGVMGETIVFPGPVNPRVIQIAYAASITPANHRKEMRRVQNGTDGTWTAWTQVTGLDLPWTDVTVNSGFAALSTAEKPQVRMVGGVVYGKGGWASSGVSAVSTQYGVGQLPAAFLLPVPTGVRATAYAAYPAMNGNFVIDTSGAIFLRTSTTITGASYYLFGHSPIFIPDSTP